jgi:hypothetical protein
MPKAKRQNIKLPPRFELGLWESEPQVMTTTLREQVSSTEWRMRDDICPFWLSI